MLFDIAPSEIALIVVVAVVVIGPKDMPRALRMAGRWIGKARRVSGHFRSSLEQMIREAELQEMETKWREQNEAVMRAHPPSLPIDETIAANAPATALIEHVPAAIGDTTPAPAPHPADPAP